MSWVLQLRLSSRNGSYRPDISYFNFWVGHFCKDGLVQKLGRILIIMAEEGPKGNVTTYRILLRGIATKVAFVEKIE